MSILKKLSDRKNCYQETGSLRGRKFSNKFIQMGWYTYDLRGDTSTFGSKQVWGDKQPVITATIHITEGDILEEMFDQVLKDP